MPNRNWKERKEYWKKYFLGEGSKSVNFRLGGFRFFVGFFGLSFCFRSVRSRRRARLSAGAKKASRQFFGERKALQERLCGRWQSRTGMARLFFFRKNRFFSCKDRWIGFFSFP